MYTQINNYDRDSKKSLLDKPTLNRILQNNQILLGPKNKKQSNSLIYILGVWPYDGMTNDQDIKYHQNTEDIKIEISNIGFWVKLVTRIN